MPTLYVISSKYMHLIANEDLLEPSPQAMSNARIFHSEKITKEKLVATFNDSKPLMVGFKTKEEAMIAITASLIANNTNPDFIDGSIPFFAVPVIYTVQHEEGTEQAKGNLQAEQLYPYMEADSIPYFDPSSRAGMWKDGTIRQMNNRLKDGLEEVADLNDITHYLIEREHLCILEASYLACNPVREAVVHFNNVEADLEDIHNQENPPATRPACAIM